MSLPSTGSLSLSQVNTELGRGATAQISLGETAVRNLAEIASGAISFQNLRGKANVFAFTIAANQTDVNLRTLAVNAGWNESALVEATIGSGVVISGSVQNNSTAALTVNGSWPNGITLINNGTIAGRGGNGGNGGSNISRNGIAGSTGGRALLVSVPLSLNNVGTIASGGGGGGGGGSAREPVENRFAGGGGGGGGRSSNTNSSGGTGGSSGGGAVQDGKTGVGGNLSSSGAGGAGGVWSGGYGTVTGGTGGAGGDRGASGNTGGSVSGGTGGIGGGSGEAISGNSNITYIATGTRVGTIT